jgi:hypothetical protein
MENQTAKAKYHRRFYKKTWIDKKICHILSKQLDKRYYLFPNVLSAKSIDTCMIDALPRTGFAELESGRKWTRDGCKNLTLLLRKQVVHFRLHFRLIDKKEIKEVLEVGNEEEQTMQFASFYLKVAEMLKLSKPFLAPLDFILRHETTLAV